MGSKTKIFYDAAPIGSVSALATALGFTEKYIRHVAAQPGAHYTVFTKNVRGKSRVLAEPHPPLKMLQKRIVSRIFCHLEFPPYLHGGIKTDDPRDFITNAASHKNAETAITLDIRNFFPSITIKQVNHAFQHLFHFPKEVATILAELSTLNGELPQGASTSSYIANFVMWEREYKLVSGLQAKGLEYTRLIDDISISSIRRLQEKDISKVINNVAGLLTSYQYVLHPKKKSVRSKSNPQHLMEITGLWLNRGAPRLARKKREEISRSAVHVYNFALTNGVYSSDYHKMYNSTFGRVALLTRLGHSEAGRLRALLNQVRPLFDAEACGKIAGIIRRFYKKKSKSEGFGYLKAFYKLQYLNSIIARTDEPLAKELQSLLNRRRPATTMRKIYA